MRLSACITTRNRIRELDACLRALWNSRVTPYEAIVSDDSPDQEVQERNRQVVEKYPGSTYLIGPRAGVSANRNNAVNAITDTDLVAFIDDDIFVDPSFIAYAIDRYTQMTSDQRVRSILSGITRNQYGCEIHSIKLSFRGYFCSTDAPEAVNIHAAVFPWCLFKEEQWDENIFFGYEDAELCLRALKRGYCIIYCPEIKALHTSFEMGTLSLERSGSLTDYEIYVEAARLYVGIKRYKYLFPNLLKLITFISLYFIHMTVFLLKRREIKAFPKIIRLSNIQCLCRFYSSSATPIRAEDGENGVSSSPKPGILE